jgi:hypothetical protein
VDVRALISQPPGFLKIGAIDLGIVLQLAWCLHAAVERLAITRVWVSLARFEEVATLTSQSAPPC